MAEYFYADLGSVTSPSLNLESVNKGDSNLYFKITPTGNYTLTPGSVVKAIIVPSNTTTLSSPSGAFSVSGLLTRLRGSKPYNDSSLGIYSVIGGENNSSSNVYLSFSDIKINNYAWENTSFDLHWLFQRGNVESYGSVSGVYSLPHNIQNNEVVISGLLIDSGNLMRYNLYWNNITNEGSTNYGSGSYADGPYRCLVNYAWNSGVVDVTGFVDWNYYPSGVFSSGITFDIPYMDPRINAPAIYNFNIANVGAGLDQSGSLIKVIKIDHQSFIDSENYFKNMDDEVFNSPNISFLKKVDEIKIEPGIINRKRLSIGINDIAIKNNTYVKQGFYISPYYPLDFNIYTFSLKVKEYIPEYDGLNQYDIIKYFCEFNSKWERISPITRGDELYNGILIPKLFVFDSGTNTSNVKYLEFGNVRSFRIKIVFDLSSIKDNKFISPEIYDYKCMIFNKDQFLNI